MARIIVAMPKIEDAKKIGEMLKSRGMHGIELCTTGSAVLSRVHNLDSGIVICTKRFKDMYYSDVAENLPDYFEMLLLISQEGVDYYPSNVVTITMPFHVSDLLSSVEMMTTQVERRLRKLQTKTKKRNEEEQKCINEAKRLLMERNNMTEPEAFRYIQKCSMDSSTNMVETAQMILMLQVD